MRAVIQRASSASIRIGGKAQRSMGSGLVILLGIEEADSEEDVRWLSGKISRLRIFNDPDRIMNLSVADVQGDLLIVSQFTLHASTKKGNRPSYIKAARPEHATPLYQAFIQAMRDDTGLRVITGEFGAMMQVSLCNDGPVTILIDTKNKE